jgi:hypothetical protein
LTAAGAARGINVMRGVSQPEVRWDERVLDTLFASALLGYLAVAHHGRGRGAWVAQQPPSAWVAAVDAAMDEQRDAIQALWQAPRQDGLQARVRVVLERAGADVLVRLYPAAAHLVLV